MSLQQLAVPARRAAGPILIDGMFTVECVRPGQWMAWSEGEIHFARIERTCEAAITAGREALRRHRELMRRRRLLDQVIAHRREIQLRAVG